MAEKRAPASDDAEIFGDAEESADSVGEWRQQTVTQKQIKAFRARQTQLIRQLCGQAGNSSDAKVAEIAGRIMENEAVILAISGNPMIGIKR